MPSMSCVDFFQKMLPIGQDNSVTLFSENFSKLCGEYRVDVCKNAFNEGRAMFCAESMYGVPPIRDMVQDFGILPPHKCDLEQKEYASLINGHGTCVSVPTTVSVDRCDSLGRIIEDMAYYSMDTVRPAFIEKTLKGKFARDNDSADMIDIIIKSLRIDYTQLLASYGLSIEGDIRSMMNKGSTEIASLLATKKESWEQKLEKISDEFLALQKKRVSRNRSRVTGSTGLLALT